MPRQVYIFPASFAQRRLWFLDQLAPGNPAYNLHNAIRLSSAPNLAALEQSLNEIVRRHESLRTTFKAVDGEPVQVVAASMNLALPVVDLMDLPECGREEEGIRIATEEALRPFDLSEGPLLRTSILRMGEEDYIFLLTVHHIICDFWSMNVFFEEVATVYQAFCAGQPSPLPGLPIQYADFAEWEWQRLQEPAGKSHLDYWRTQLADLPVLRMPTDWPRPAVQSFKGSVCNFWLTKPLYLGLLELTQKEDVTLFMALLAAFQTLLYRYTAQDDIAVGTPVANRNRVELEGLVGFFVNSVVLRTDLSGNPRFRELMARVRDVALDAYAHQDLPFEKLVRELKPERDMGHNPLFQVHFQLFSDMGSVKQTGPLDGESLEIERGAAIFDLALDLWEYPDGLQGMLEYSTDLFSEETICRMVEHFRILLEDIVADPDKRLSDLSLLNRSDRQQMLVDWNDTETPYATDGCLHQLFEAQVERTPDAVAISFRFEQLTYRELNHRANQLGLYLQSLGVGPGHLVAICAERSLEMIVGLLGILKAGGAYLPLDPSYPKERMLFMMEDSQPQVLLTQRRFVQIIPSSPPKCLCLDADWERVASFSDAHPISEVKSQNLAYVIYTSGSTGKPKGVLIPHQAVCNHLLWMLTAFPLTAADRIPQKYPFNFDASVCEIFSPLLAGARLIITEPFEHWDIGQFIQLLIEQEITVLDLLPSMLQALLEDERFSACRSLRRIICGGESLSPELRDRFFAQMDTELINVYGPTEATIGSTSWTCRRGDSEYRVPIGRPISNTQVYLLDPHLNPVPIGVPGELYIGGDGLARGYLNRPDLTADRFIPNPFSRKTGCRLYKTGDLARYLPGGSIEYLGRMDQQVKVRGYRIELGEIESAMAQHSSIRACAVLAREDEPDQMKLVAYVVPSGDTPELWPSVGEYGVYDELLYYAMTHDEGRNRSYRAAINEVVKGKTVLDIGTGADAVLARFCIDGGAERVYAIEVSEAAYRRARELVQRLGLDDRIILIHGDSTRVELPEKVDACVSELLGMIGSSEGVALILNDARRFLKDEGIMIPQRCVTRVAPICLPEELAARPTLTELPRLYVEEVFMKVGHPFDLRMCIKNFPLSNLLSESQVFEDLNFTSHVEPECYSEVTFSINKKSRFDGFLLWLNLELGGQEMIDSLNHRHNWLPVFFPAFYPGLEVSEGDVIKAVCSCRLSSDTRMPDFRIKGTLNLKGGAPIAFDHSSPHRTNAFKANPFYESLFAGVDGQPPYLQLIAGQISKRRNGDEQLQASPAEESVRGLVPTLRRFLQEQLPEYMIPAAFVLLGDLPLTPGGKLDRRALPAPGQGRPEVKGAYVAPRNEAEDVLAKIWSGLLGLERIGVHDNFFELGGDSILSIQIVARANQAGFRLRPSQLFQHQTIAELAEVADTTPVTQAEQSVLTGAVPLTPIQHWFFEQSFTDPHHYNQSVLIEMPPAADAAKLGMVLDRLITHHDALRLRFTLTESGWQQTFGAANDALTLARLDLSTLSGTEREAAFEKAAAELQASLDLSVGPLVRAVLIDVGDSNATYLFLVIHHLVIDGVSWRILLEDLWTAYEQVMDAVEIQLPPKTTSFQLWAHRLAEYAQCAELERETAYWLTLSHATDRRLPRDYPEGENTAASASTIAVALSVEETRALLQDIPKAYHTQINDVLLTALVQAFSQWTGDHSLLVDVEGHGREPIIEEADLSRTIGWFTTICPVYLRLGLAANPGEALKSIKEQLRAVPHRGIGYGLLRYLRQNVKSRDTLKTLLVPEVSFNYLGQFGPSQFKSSCWRRLTELTGPNLSPRGHRPNLLEIDGSITDGCLEFVLTYSENIHGRTTIETLAEEFMEALRRLISYCSLSDVASYTPSDFSKAGLSQKELDKLISKL